MPELPEIESLRRSLEPLVKGPRISSVRIARRDVVRTPENRAPTQADLLRGQAVAGLDRLGKQLAIIGSQGSVICVHLGMSGQLLHTPDPRSLPTDHVHVRWALDDGSVLAFRDPRRFGGLWCAPGLDELRSGRWSELGPDALTVSAKDLRAALGASQRAVKPALLDQRALAGVGNIYADESLHRAGIHPLRSCRDLTDAEWRDLARAIRAILARAIEGGGSTLRDYRDANAREGGYQAEHRVYGRGGEPCTSCGSIIVRTVVAQRSTCHCPSCQPDR